MIVGVGAWTTASRGFVAMVVQIPANNVTTQRHAALSCAEFETALLADSNRRINMADDTAAATLHKSPALRASVPPTSLLLLPKASKAVPPNAIRADSHVAMDKSLPNKILARKGTNLTLRYSRNPDL